MTALGVYEAASGDRGAEGTAGRGGGPGIARLGWLGGWLGRWLRRWRWWVLAFALALAWDRAVFVHLSLAADVERLRLIERADWYMALRVLGSLQTWVVLGVVFVLIDWGRGAGHSLGRDPLRRGTVLVLAAGLAGLACEVLKPVIGRMRPEDTDGWNVFWPIGQRLAEWSDCGLPSSHTGVAAAALLVLAWMYPAARWALVLLAAGCAWTRVMSGAHFLSDVIAGAAIGYACARVIWRADAANNEGVGLDRGE